MLLDEIKIIIESCGCHETLKEVSKSDEENNKYMSNVEDVFFQKFDTKVRRILLEKEELKHLVNNFDCVDSVCIKDDKIYFLEFKNCATLSEIDKEKTTKRKTSTTVEIKTVKKTAKLKGIESLVILFHILKEKGMNINFKELLSLDINYIIIYNPFKELESSQNVNRRALNITTAKSYDESGEVPNNSVSGINFYKETYFSNIQIMSIKKFEDHYLQIFA